MEKITEDYKIHSKELIKKQNLKCFFEDLNEKLELTSTFHWTERDDDGEKISQNDDFNRNCHSPIKERLFGLIVKYSQKAKSLTNTLNLFLKKHIKR